MSEAVFHVPFLLILNVISTSNSCLWMSEMTEIKLSGISNGKAAQSGQENECIQCCTFCSIRFRKYSCEYTTSAHYSALRKRSLWENLYSAVYKLMLHFSSNLPLIPLLPCLIPFTSFPNAVSWYTRPIYAKKTVKSKLKELKYYYHVCVRWYKEVCIVIYLHGWWKGRGGMA